MEAVNNILSDLSNLMLLTVEEDITLIYVPYAIHLHYIYMVTILCLKQYYCFSHPINVTLL